MISIDNIVMVSALKDNYIWLFFDEYTRQTWVVDPGEAGPVIVMLKHYQLQLVGILITHHHNDHSGGVDELIRYAGNLQVIGSEKSPLKCITHFVEENDEVACSPWVFKILDIPGHTLDHVAYYNEKIIFCGDTLFSAGCGRIFEGTYAQMFHALNKILLLPKDINIYCGHEYTLANLAFAQTVEPENKIIQQKIQLIKEYRTLGRPSLPARLSEEKKINPFLRCDQPAVKKAVEKYVNKNLNTPLEVFTYLREWKSSFK